MPPTDPTPQDSTPAAPPDRATRAAALGVPPDVPLDATLDPSDWGALDATARELVSELLAWLRDVRERPAWRPVPDAVKRGLDEPAPRAGRPFPEIVERIRTEILPYPTGNVHPRFFGWVHGTGTAEGALAELVAGVMNANVGGREHVAPYLERQVVGWFADLFGLPETAGGLLLSGTSMANLLAMAVARNTRLEASGHDVARDGLAGLPGVPTVYASSESHVSVRKACELLGLGARALRTVPCDADRRIDPDALAAAIAADREAGRLPFCVVGNAGTTNTGAIDDLAAVADVCAAHGLWFHVDAAFGGAAILCERLRPLLRGIERADSIAFDLHKWLHVPYDAGCVLVRDGGLQRKVFAVRQAYLESERQGTAAGDPWFCDLGPELSRGFRALKAWVTLQAHGLDRLAAMVEKNCAQARYLAARIEERPHFELAVPVSLNVVCFHLAGPPVNGGGAPVPPTGFDEEAACSELVLHVQERGRAVVTKSRVDGRPCVRVNITNHRTTRADIDLLIEELDAVAASL